MANITNQNIQTLVELARELVDGQQPPPAGPKLEAVKKAIAALHKHKSAAEFELLGYALLGVLIDRVGSTLHAQDILNKFINGEDHE